MTASVLAGKHVLLIVGGGIAAFKILDLVRRLRERDVAVTPVLTESGKAFVTPLSLASLAGAPVHDNLFALLNETSMGHIELSRAADLVVVAPATANILAKMASGLSDDLASTLLLATDKRTLVVPAMNLRMWLHPATQRNIAQLQADGVLFCGPDEGAMACGEFGPGRMSEPMVILAAIEQALRSDTRLAMPANSGEATAASPRVVSATASPHGSADLLRGRRIVITSGPTHEPIDPVRFLTNRSSGKQGHAIAQAAARAGAEVALITGPVTQPDPPGVEVVRVQTAADMRDAVDRALPADIFIAAAAVSDWRLATPSRQKIKKRGETRMQLELIANPDILAGVAGRRNGRPRIVVGFAAETDQLIANAQEKRVAKGCDLILVNDVGLGTDVFGGDRNTITVIGADHVATWPEMSKGEVGVRLMQLLAEELSR